MSGETESINLIVQYVNDPRPQRQAEYDDCLRRNLANPYVKSVHDLQERGDVTVPEDVARHPKFKQSRLDRWMTFADAFAYANQALAGETCCVANLDIFLDPTSDWSQVSELLRTQRMVLCLSRCELAADGTIFRDPHLMHLAFANAQDAWVFRTPIAVERCDFGVGTMGCDNAIAHRIKQAGYLPLNAPQRCRVVHVDRARGKTIANQDDIYRAERREKEPSRAYPEREGQYLLPDIDMVKSVDQILTEFRATELERYAVICDVFSRFVKVTNQ
jgi:hypothetical protein